MKRLLNWISCLLLLMASSLSAQTSPCYFDSLNTNNVDWQRSQDMFKSDWYKHNEPQHQLNFKSSSIYRSINTDKSLFVIPVVVHVLIDPADATAGPSNISNAQIENAIATLNTAFEGNGGTTNTGMKFCLAKVGPNQEGVYRHNSQYTFHTVRKDEKIRFNY